MRIPLFTWVFLAILLGILVCNDVGFVSGQCQTDQQSLLLQFKKSLRVYQSKRLVSWNTSVDCCKWEGITCDKGGLGRVVGLNLSNESITGVLENSTGLFGLQFLQNLDLSFNNFNLILPARFGILADLVSLNLSNAGFIGQIPIEISNLTRLVILDLSMLYFPGVPYLKLENPKFAALVQNLTRLTELHLDGVNISASGYEWCQALSSFLPNLQVLSLSNCFLSGPFDTSLSQLRSLSVIRLSNNNLNTSVPEFFANFLSMSVLQLSSCELKGTFPDKIFQVATLKILDLSNNKNLQGSFPKFNHNLSLQTMVLSYTSFSGALPYSIGYLDKLSKIELVNCRLSGSIPISVANLTQLVYLDFPYNMFRGPIPLFWMSKNLSSVNLSHNNLAGGIPTALWESLQRLVYVDLRNNALSGSIPASLFSIQSLQKILISFNQLGGQLPEFGNASFSSLEALDLSSNKLEGSIPKSLFDLQRLNVLALASNKLNGTIKLQSLGKLGDLTTLDLSYNNLIVDAGASNYTSSFLPAIKTMNLASCNLREFPDLSKQTKLFSLDLSGNQINGAVPSWIWQADNGSIENLNVSGNRLTRLQDSPHLSNLVILDLSNNRLQGNVPIPPQTATYVDYSNNNINSSIPPDIVNNLNFIFFFSLANNSLTGVIPASLCNATYLQVLDLSKNNLSGIIPECLLWSDNLFVLNLRRNNFHGSIPDAFPGSCQLKTLDVSGNQLVGNVSKSLANCTALEVLDLGNNQMKDVFPCHLENIANLRVLILRSNNFYGPIGCPKNNSTWAKLQIVDIAANNFSGKLPEKCLTTWATMMGNGTDTYDHLRFKPLKLTELYYLDSITVTIKGLEMELVKIITVFTSIDFSNNNFEGPIPEVMGRFTALYVLNLSHNSFSGQIPSYLGNLLQLESLDLSYNNLSGAIPQQLARLTFLSVLNLSYNRLVGQTPTGNQLQTFDQNSYLGNKGLCGLPLENNCSHETPPEISHSHSGKDINWYLINVELGFVFGFGSFIASLIFWKGWRIWYCKHVDRVLFRIFPQLDRRRNRNYQRRARRIRERGQ